MLFEQYTDTETSPHCRFHTARLVGASLVLAVGAIPLSVTSAQAVEVDPRLLLGLSSQSQDFINYIENNNCYQNPDFKKWVCPTPSTEFHYNVNGLITTVFLHRGYDGELPFKLSFNDMPADVIRKMGRPADWVSTTQRSAAWYFNDGSSLNVTYPDSVDVPFVMHYVSLRLT
jgi:hypothetical protein